MPTVDIKGPLSHQLACYISAALRKILQCGRRWGKTRIAFCMAIVGHGPQGNWELTIGRDEAERTIQWEGPLHRGCAQGWDVYWIARDYKQAGILWREEVVPVFKPLGGGVTVNESDRRIDFHGQGSFYIRSAENINSVRGSGQKLAGVIVDEAAFLNLEEAMKDVLLPALLDNHGWLVLMSTTNAGQDGWEDLEEGKRSPSYFNILCERFDAGELGPEYAKWHGTAYDNPALSPSAIDALIKEYTGDRDVGDLSEYDDPALQQEVFARLLTAGAGVAFPEFRQDVHLRRYQPEQDGRFRWAVGGDWGYAKPGWLGLIATGPERSLVRWEMYFRHQSPYQVGYDFGKAIMRFPKPEWVCVDVPAVSDGGPTIDEEIQRGLVAAVGKNAPPVITPPKGPGSRITKKALLHDMLKYSTDANGQVPEWGRPKLEIHADDCPHLARTLEKLPRDPKKPEDVDTDAEDHPYDGLTAWAMARIPRVEAEKPKRDHPDDHPGFKERYGSQKEQDTIAVMLGGAGRTQRWSRRAHEFNWEE